MKKKPKDRLDLAQTLAKRELRSLELRGLGDAEIATLMGVSEKHVRILRETFAPYALDGRLCDAADRPLDDRRRIIAQAWAEDLAEPFVAALLRELPGLKASVFSSETGRPVEPFSEVEQAMALIGSPLGAMRRALEHARASKA